jgi:hypothetical protein
MNRPIKLLFFFFFKKKSLLSERRRQIPRREKRLECHAARTELRKPISQFPCVDGGKHFLKKNVREKKKKKSRAKNNNNKKKKKNTTVPNAAPRTAGRGRRSAATAVAHAIPVCSRAPRRHRAAVLAAALTAVAVLNAGAVPVILHRRAPLRRAGALQVCGFFFFLKIA